MRELGSRVLVGLGVIVAAVVAFGYAFVYLGIATPPGGDLATLDVPPDGEVAAAHLDDGRPVYVVNVADEVGVVDARAPHQPGVVAALVAWCVKGELFLEPRGGGAFGPDGQPQGEVGGAGLALFATRPGPDGSIFVVESASGPPADPAGSADAAPGCPPTSSWVVHAPDPVEIFDPSVAVDEEPPGWIWLEGTLSVVDGQPRLCDGLDAGCAGWADLAGIDPATVESASGTFLGRVRDGAVEGLVSVPDLGGDS